MNVTELVDRVAVEHGLTKAHARSIVEAVFKALTEATVQGEEVAITGFGRFKVTDRSARQGRNPATGEIIEIAASRKLAFTAAKSIRDQLNAPKPTARKVKPATTRAAK